MNAKLISIGNSKGVRLPKGLIVDWKEDQELIILKKGATIVIQPVLNNREEWAIQINADAETNEEVDFIPNEFDENHWTW